MSMIRISVMLFWLGALVAHGAGNIDATSESAWAENGGWLQAAATNAGVSVHFYGSSGYLSGHAWGENIGWVKFGANTGGPYVNTTATNWGVNLSSSGTLSGHAWGENVGWITFDPAFGGVMINFTNGTFSGRAWGENIGWLTFKGTSPDYGLRTLAFDTQAQGTPNWWLDHHAVTETTEDGDQVPAWKEYVADTDPNDPGSYFRILSISNAPPATQVAFTPASPGRSYTLLRRSLLTNGWNHVAGQAGVPGTGGENTLHDTNAWARMFYTVEVTVTP
ncbi:MAG: hypothetical protein ACI9X0_002328 [Kiritimatiellia bacterium]|jgi:hypothetical protein